MRSCFIAILIGCACSGCGDDDDAPATSQAGKDGGVEDGGASATTDSAGLRALISDFVGAYDRQMRATCACYADAGAFPSADLCFDLVGSGPTWIDCATKVLSKRDTGKAEADARCMIEKAEARADCLESASCADLSPCDQLPIECPAQDSELQVLILEECPDTGLLSRLDGGA